MAATVTLRRAAVALALLAAVTPHAASEARSEGDPLATARGQADSPATPLGQADSPATARGRVNATPDATGQVTLTLDQAIDRAVRFSDELRFARRGTDLAATRYLRERRNYFPALSVSYSTDTSVTPLSPDSRSRRLSAGLRQTLYDGGALTRSRRLQQAEIAIERRELERLEREVRSEAWRSTVELQLSERRMVARRSALDAARRALRIAEQQFELGIITEREIVEAQLARVEHDEDLRAADLDLERARFELSRLLHYPPGVEIRITGGFSPEVGAGAIEASVEELFSEATRANPELRRSRLELERARERALEAERRFTPHVAATFDLSLAAETLPLRDPDLSVGVEISWQTDTPVTAGLTAGAAADGERRRGTRIAVEPLERLTSDIDRASARLELEQHRSDVDELESRLRFSIAEGLALFELAVDRLESAGERRELAALHLSIVEAEAEIGAARPIDVLDAVRALLEAELGQLEAAYDVSLRRREIEDLAGAYEEEM